MKHKRRSFTGVVIILLFVGVVLVGRPAQATRFVLAAHSWSYPDEYGQGIEYVYFVNSLDETPYNWSYQYWNNTESATLDFKHNCSVSIRVHTWMNATFTGYTFAEGRDYFTRVGIKMYSAGALVFEQTNLTQAGGSSTHDPMMEYDYTILLNGDPLYLGPVLSGGMIFTVVFTYEISMWS